MFLNNIHIRMRYIFIIVIAILIIIIGKVIYIQVIQYEELNILAENLWSRNLPIKADRGLITDRNGEILADNITTTSLVFIPNQIKDKEKVAKDISEILAVNYEEIYKHISKRTSIERVHPEGRRLSYEIADQINSLNYDGVYLLKESKRYYPYGNLLAHSLGYVGIDNQGLSGLELIYDRYLTGSDGAIKYFSDGRGNRLELAEVYEQPQKGMNIELTIDIDVQLAIERELDNIISSYNADNALIIAMNPNNGEILGIGSRPSFNPNDYQNYNIEEINRNLPIWMTYEPGSTFKIITMASAIEEKVVNVFEDKYYDSGSIKVAGGTLHCWRHGGHGEQSFLEVAENSCNPGFVNLGLKLGKEKLFSYINSFGFGKKTGIDLNGETAGILFKLSQVNELELATTSFGQGISVTPLQQVTSVSTVINGGNLYKPYIVSQIKEPETNDIIVNNKKILVRNVISEETSDIMRYVLESVVANGTGRNAYLENYRIGGKTGTAQKVQNGRYMIGNYILSFIGFLPADKPEIVLYVAVDNPKNTVQYGGTVAGPIARNIFIDFISKYNIVEDKNGLPKEYLWTDIKYVKVPNVIGMNIKDAQKILKSFKIEYTGKGEKVIYQTPESNSLIKENGTIKLLLE